MKNPPALRGSRALAVQKYLAQPGGLILEDRANPWYTSHKAYWDAMAKKVDGATFGTMRWLDPLDDPLAYPELHPAGYPADDVPRRLAGPVTINKRPTAKVTAINVTELVELAKRGRGRPRTGNAMSAAERKRKERANKIGLPPRRPV